MIIHTLVIQSMLQYWPNRKVIQILLKVATQMEHKKDTVSTNVDNFVNSNIFYQTFKDWSLWKTREYTRYLIFFWLVANL